MAENNEARGTKVFISYSRKDKVFARKLNDALDAAGVDAWVDWEGIELASDWMSRITAAIEGGDAFLFIITPDSLSSTVCADELELGIKLNKKIIPILYRDPEKKQAMHPKLASTNWVYMRPRKDDFNKTIPKLIESIQTDLGWVQQHTRLTQRAGEWTAKSKTKGFLLQGEDLEEGERWMTESASGEGRQVLPIQADYISTSRKVAVQRQRNIMFGVVVALIVSIAASVFAFFQWRDALAQKLIADEQRVIAEGQRKIADEQKEIALQNELEAKADRSAAQATIYQDRPGELGTSALLALDSWGRVPNIEAEDILRHNISLMPTPLFQVKHEDAVWEINLSADGQYFATPSFDQTACVWTIAGEKKFCVKHEGDVNDALLTADNSLLITASGDGTVKMWDGANGASVQEFSFDGKTIYDIDISPDGKHLAVAREDGLVTLIDIAEKKSLIDVTFSAGKIYTVDFDPTGAWLAGGSSTGQVRYWRVLGSVSNVGAVHEDEVLKVLFSPNGEWLVSIGADNMARVTKTISGGQKFALRHDDWVEDVVFAPDSSWFATASDDKTLRVWDIDTGIEQVRMTQASFISKLTVSSNGKWLLSAGYDNTARIWDASSGAPQWQMYLEDAGSAVAFTADGTRAITGDHAGSIVLWDVASLEARTAHLEAPELIQKAKFNKSGDWFLFNVDDRTVWKIQTADAEASAGMAKAELIYKFEKLTQQLRLSPDGKWLGVSLWEGYTNQKAILYNMETKQVISLPGKKDVSSISFTPDGAQFATTEEDSAIVTIWDVATGVSVDTIELDGVAYYIAFNSKNSTLAVGMSNKTVIWDLVGKKVLHTLPQIGEIQSITFSKDYSMLATASDDGGIFIWDIAAETLDAPKFKFSQGGSVTTLDFNYENTWLASGGSNGFAYIWNVQTGEEITRVPHADAMAGVSFSPKDNKLVTTASKSLQFWDIEQIEQIHTPQIVEITCSKLLANFTQSEWEFFFEDEDFRKICADLP